MVTKAELKLLMSEDHRAERQALLDRCLANDEWANKIFKKLAILIVSCPSQRAYLKACVESHAKLGYFICLAYDNEYELPDKEILEKVDLLLLPHHQTWKDVNYPYFWQLKWGASALQQFEYIYCLNGDFVLEKPEGFEQLFSLMGDADVMTCGPDGIDDEVPTGAFIVKSKAFQQIVQYMQDHFIPFDTYEKYSVMGGAEARMYAAIKQYGLKMVSVEKPAMWDCNIAQGTWYDLVGLRHIHGELHYAFVKQLEPPHYKYIEERYLLPVYNYKLIKEYWDTYDINILKNWWRE